MRSRQNFQQLLGLYYFLRSMGGLGIARHSIIPKYILLSLQGSKQIMNSSIFFLFLNICFLSNGTYFVKSWEYIVKKNFLKQFIE